MDEKKERKKKFYLEKQTGAKLERSEEDFYKITFQYEEIKLHDALEAHVLDGCDAYTTRNISQENDDFMITVTPHEDLMSFQVCRRKAENIKLCMARALIQDVRQHQNDKLHFIICPENVLVSESLDIVWIHYGVHNSIPPYEKDDEKTLLELRATLLVLLDGQYHFDEYLNDHGTLKLSPKAASLMKQNTLEGLRDLISKWMKAYEQEDAELHKMPRTRWRIQKWIGIGLIAALVPAAVYIVYVLAFLQPRQVAFTESHKSYLKENYSEVVDILAPYEPKVMPQVVKYELAHSYVAIEKLQKHQLDNLENVLVLQAAEEYFDYWIAIGRGENEEAIDIARGLRDKEWLAYANIKYREEVQGNDDLSGKEKEELLEKIEDDIDEYLGEKKEQEEENQENTIPASGEVNEEEVSPSEVEKQEQKQDDQKQDDKKEDKDKPDEKKDDKNNDDKKDGGDK